MMITVAVITFVLLLVAIGLDGGDDSHDSWG